MRSGLLLFVVALAGWCLDDQLGLHGRGLYVGAMDAVEAEPPTTTDTAGDGEVAEDEIAAQASEEVVEEAVEETPTEGTETVTEVAEETGTEEAATFDETEEVAEEEAVEEVVEEPVAEEEVIEEPIAEEEVVEEPVAEEEVVEETVEDTSETLKASGSVSDSQEKIKNALDKVRKGLTGLVNRVKGMSASDAKKLAAAALGAWGIGVGVSWLTAAPAATSPGNAATRRRGGGVIQRQTAFLNEKKILCFV